MMLLSISGLSLSFGERKILQDVSFNVSKGDRIGIVGVNGAGKTTLLRLLTGQLSMDKGSIYRAKLLQTGYLQQEDPAIKELCLLDAVMEVYGHFIEMEEALNHIARQMEGANEEELLRLNRKYADLTERFETKGGFEYASRARGILAGLGFSEEEFLLPVKSLSGGQRSRLMMARLLAVGPELLFLDEPTNHLDMNALAWLEGFLNGYNGAFLVVSHDRYFLDKVCNGILELENAQAVFYKGNYSSYIEKKNADREIQQRAYENQLKEIERLKEFIEQQKRWNRERNIIAAESRQKAIDRMDKIDAPSNLPQKVRIRIEVGKESGNDVLEVKNAAVRFGEKQIIEDLSFSVKKGERLFILGPNGCGKSTLLKLITDKLPKNGAVTEKKGSISYGVHVKSAYYDQELFDLSPENTLFEEILSMEEKLSETAIRNTLAGFLFKGDDVFKKISALSGGEKSRVMLSKIILSSPNLIILDEPTNHLDIHSRELLEEALLDFAGTILCVSHDRYFIRKLATRILDFNGRDIFDYAGDYESYVEFKGKKEQAGFQVEKKEKTYTESKEQYSLTKEEKARERKAKKMLENTEQRILQLEELLLAIGREMESEDVMSDHIKLAKLLEEKNQCEKELEELYQKWVELS